METVERVIKRLDKYQQNAVVKALMGTKGGMLTILGYGGCGKTSTLATLIMCLALLGYRTVVLSQSNKTVQAVMEQYVDLVQGTNSPR
jgi:Tfp pilus assembly pilus retraction ATPase PilT